MQRGSDLLYVINIWRVVMEMGEGSHATTPVKNKRRRRRYLRGRF